MSKIFLNIGWMCVKMIISYKNWFVKSKIKDTHRNRWVSSFLFGTKCYNRVFLGGDGGGEQTCQQRQDNADSHKNYRGNGRQYSTQAGNACQRADYDICGYAYKHRRNDTDSACGKANYYCFGVEYALDILLGCADSAENTYLLDALQY